MIWSLVFVCVSVLSVIALFYLLNIRVQRLERLLEEMDDVGC